MPRSLVKTPPAASQASRVRMSPAKTADTAIKTSAVIRAVAVREDVGDTQISANPAVRVKRRVVRNVARRVQVELTTAIDQIAFTALILKQRKVMFATGETHRFASVQRPDRHLFVRHAPVEDTVIIGNRAVWFESTLGTSVFLVRSEERRV